jgi:hypothetical protein
MARAFQEKYVSDVPFVVSSSVPFSICMPCCKYNNWGSGVVEKKNDTALWPPWRLDPQKM